MNIDDNKVEGINGMGKEDDLLLSSDISNEKNQGNHFGAYQYENQHNIFGSNVNNDDEESSNNTMEKDQAVKDNNNNAFDDEFVKNNLDNQGSNDSDSDHESDNNYND